MKKTLLILAITCGLTQITKAQSISCLSCDQLGMSVNVGSDTNMIKLYHAGQYLTHPQAHNVFAWEVTDMQGNIISQDTVVNGSDYYIFYNTHFSDTMNVTVYLRNDSTILSDGNIVNCLFEDQLYCEVGVYPSSTLLGAWEFIHNNVGVDQNVLAAVNDVFYSNKKLIKIVDLCKESIGLINQPLFYIYDDGSVEKEGYIRLGQSRPQQ
jgi:hypothetical protein